MGRDTGLQGDSEILLNCGQAIAITILSSLEDTVQGSRNKGRFQPVSGLAQYQKQ